MQVFFLPIEFLLCFSQVGECNFEGQENCTNHSRRVPRREVVQSGLDFSVSGVQTVHVLK